MTIKSAGNKSIIIILTAAVFLCICGSVYAANPKAVKLPVFKNAKNIKFDDDDQKFFAWLNEYFPEEAATLIDNKNVPSAYNTKFRAMKSRFRRLWKGYKESEKLGKALVVEVKHRFERNDVLDEYKASTDKKTKERLYNDLFKVVSKEFDIAMEIKRIKYEELRPRILRMKDYLTKRESEVKKLIEHKNAEVKKRVEALLKEGKVDPYWIYPKNKGIAPQKEPSIKPAVFKDVKFTEDDQKFFVWLNEFFPNYAQDIKDLAKNPKEYVEKFNKNKSMFRRLWRGYKYNHRYGKILVDEVKLRVERFGVLTKLQTAKGDEQKAKLRNDLNKIVSEEFEVAVKLKKHRYEGLKRKIKRMERDLAKREEEVKKLVENKTAEVKKRVKDLITGEEKINWK